MSTVATENVSDYHESYDVVYDDLIILVDEMIKTGHQYWPCSVPLDRLKELKAWLEEEMKDR